MIERKGVKLYQYTWDEEYYYFETNEGVKYTPYSGKIEYALETNDFDYIADVIKAAKPYEDPRKGERIFVKIAFVDEKAGGVWLEAYDKEGNRWDFDEGHCVGVDAGERYIAEIVSALFTKVRLIKYLGKHRNIDYQALTDDELNRIIEKSQEEIERRKNEKIPY